MTRRERRTARAVPAPSWQACGAGRFIQSAHSGAAGVGLAEQRT